MEATTTSGRSPPTGGLPWESQGPPRTIGVCLSGGGLRAASFALGTVQALQEERGLFFGARSADHLAVVSGGSYLAATLLLNAAHLAKENEPGPAPLAQGTPEAEHVLSHGAYLKNLATARRMISAGLLNVAAFAVLFLWTGALLVGSLKVGANELGIEQPAETIPLLLAGATTFFVGGGIFLRGLYKACGWPRMALRLAGLGILLVGAPSIVAAMERIDPLSHWGWWSQDLRLLLAFGTATAVVLLSLGAIKLWPPSARLASWITTRVPVAIGLVLFCLAATSLSEVFERGLHPHEAGDARDASLLFFAILIGAVVMERAAARVSLHGIYRDRLAQCFSVRRSGQAVEAVGPTDQTLSGLEPPSDAARSFPRLLICATANVIWDPEGPGRTTLQSSASGKRKFASFVYSHDRCGLPGIRGVSFATGELEKLERPKDLMGAREPLVSLMTGVASTGAAVSPAMGRRTIDAARPILALSNLRLGCWLPNPLSACIAKDVAAADAEKRLKRRRAFGPGYDEFVPELFGLHRADASRIYISDGGHYDNLGLLALLQARCKEIWCIDSEADPKGEAGQLRQAIDLAKEDGNIDIAVDLDRFRAIDDGILGAGHAVGQITYPDQSVGTLVVIKLGLTSGSPESLKDYRRRDKPFPYHSTFWEPWRVMWYGQERFDSYRQVGYLNAETASADTNAPSGG